MNNENLNIDKLFEDSLGDLRVEPQAGSWDKIVAGVEAASAGTNRKLWGWIAFSAASVAVLVYFLFFRSCSTTGAARNYAFKDRINIIETKSYVVKTKQNSFAKTATPKAVSRKSRNHYIRKNITPEKTTHNFIRKQTTTTNIVAVDGKTVGNNDINRNSAGTVIKHNAVEENINRAETVETLAINDESRKTSIEEEAIPAVNSNELTEKLSEEKSAINSPAPAPEITTGLEIEFGAGPAFVRSNVPSNIVYDNPLIEGINSNSMTTAEGFIRVKYSVSGFYVKSGFNFSEFGGNTAFNVKTEMHDTSGGYASWILNRYWTYDTVGFYDDPMNPGVVYPILSPTYHIDTIGSQWNSKDRLYYDKTTYEARNRYRYVEIPLIVGYQHYFGRLNVYAGGGVGIGFMINATGKYFCNNELKDITRSNNPYNSHNLNYMINFGAAYSLSNKWNVFAGFNYKSNITSIIKPEYDTGIKYKATGFNLGLSYIIK
jgi:hypothetical protein